MSSYYYPSLEEGYIYHIYNRGINGENIFKKPKNYSLFLQKYAHHIPPVLDTYAYCLLKNHFHLLVRVKTVEEQKAYFEQYQRIEPAPSLRSKKVTNKGKYTSFKQLNPSRQIGHLCNGYTQAINAESASNGEKRTGALFERPFHRVRISDERYFTNAIYYIHHNPQKHGFVEDFRDYPHSSYHAFLSKKATRLERKEVLDWFGGEDYYKSAHATAQDLDGLEDWGIEFD